MSEEAPKYRQLPGFVPLGAKRDVWEYIIAEAVNAGGWAYFRVKTLPETIKARSGREYHHATISRALKALSGEGYIQYRPGDRGQVSMAKPILETPTEDNEPVPRAEGGGA